MIFRNVDYRGIHPKYQFVPSSCWCLRNDYVADVLWRPSLFYCFRLEDDIPANHLLRVIDCYVDFQLRARTGYAETGTSSWVGPFLARQMILPTLQRGFGTRVEALS